MHVIILNINNILHAHVIILNDFYNVVNFSFVIGSVIRSKELNDLLIHVPIVNIKVKEEPAIPAGVPTIGAYEAMFNVPNDADKAINILSK